MRTRRPSEKLTVAELAMDPLLDAIERLVPKDAEPWIGTPSEFYDALCALVPDNVKRATAYWPQSAVGLGQRLGRLSLGFKARGLRIDRRNSHARAIIVARVKGAA